MANEKVTALPELTTLAPEDLLYVVDDPGGTPISKRITGENLLANGPTSIIVAASDETSNLTVASPKVSFRMPHGMNLTEVRANTNTAPTGSAIQVGIAEGGVSILSTPISIDAGDTTSVDSGSPPVISDSVLADNAVITINLTAVGSVNAGTGLKIIFIGTIS